MKSKRIIWSQSGSPCEKARQNVYSDSKRNVICSSVWAAYNALQNSHPIFNWILRGKVKKLRCLQCWCGDAFRLLRQGKSYIIE